MKTYILGFVPQNIRRSFLLLSLFFGVFIGYVRATHSVSSAITVKHLGGNNYYVEGKIARRCGLWYSDNTASIRVHCGLTLINTYNLPALSFDTIKSAFGGPYPPRNNNGVFHRELPILCDNYLNPGITPVSKCGNSTGVNSYEYSIYGGVIQLPACSNLMLQLQNPCCISSSTVTSGYDFSYTHLNTFLHQKNNTPQWFWPVNLIVAACVGQKNNYHPFLHDPDGDSLIYRVECIKTTTINSCAVYQSGYSPQMPIQGFRLDSTTGNISFLPTVSGLFHVGLRVFKYDRCSGTLKNSLGHYFMIDASVCTNLLPQDSGSVRVNGAVKAQHGYKVCPGGEVYLTDTFKDENLVDSMFLITNVAREFPGASLTQQYIRGGTKNVSVIHFRWRAVNDRRTQKSLQIGVTDDHCPIAGRFFKAYNFIVENDLSLDSIYRICKGDTAFLDSRFSGGTVTWASISGDPLIWSGANKNIWSDTTATDTNLRIKVRFQTPTLLVGNSKPAACRNSLGPCATKDTTWIYPAPLFNVLLSTDTSFCKKTHLIQLHGKVDSTHFGVKWKWNSIEYLQYPDSSRPVVLANTDARYHYTVTSRDGCSRKGSMGVHPAMSVQSLLTGFVCRDVCQGSQMSLTAYTDTGNCGVSVVNRLYSISKNKPITKQYINQPTSNIGFHHWPTPFPTSTTSARQQFFYRHKYLKQMGFRSGHIGEISFYVHQLYVKEDSLIGLNIKMTCTSDSIIMGWATNTTLVYAPKNYTLKTGWNTIPLDTSFYLPAGKGLLIQICHYDPFAASKTLLNTQVELDTLSYLGTLLNEAAGSPVCSINQIKYSYYTVPLIRLGAVGFIPKDSARIRWYNPASVLLGSGRSLTFKPTLSGQHKLVISDTGIKCTDTLTIPIQLRSVNLSAGGNKQVCADDSVQVSAVLSPPLFTGNTSWHPSTLFKYPNSGSTTLYGKRNDTVALAFTNPCCQLTDTFLVQILSKPNPAISTAGPFCASTSNNPLSGVVPGGYFKGTAVDSATANFDASHPGVTPGLQTPVKSAITHVVKNVCQSDTTIYVDVYHPFDTILNTPYEYCPHDSPGLLKTRHRGGIWTGPGTQPNGLFNPSVAGIGTHNIRVDSTGFCGNSKTFFITVYPTPIVHLSSPPVLCPKHQVAALDAQNQGATFLWNTGFTQQKLYTNKSGVYWVKVTDANGCFSTDTVKVTESLTCVGLTEENAGLEIKIFPNPFREQIHLYSIPGSTLMTVTLHDLRGRELLRQTIPAGTDTYLLQVQTLASGVYILRLQSDGQSTVHRVVKQE